MSENAAAAEAPLRKEKKSLDPRIALALMIVMVIIALCNGAHKAWTKNRQGVNASYTVWQENIEQRIETAYNILTVGGRYLAADHAQMAALKADITAMQQSDAASQKALNAQAEAGARFLTDGSALLTTLQSDSRVQADSRDSMYVTLMLPQALEQCGSDTALADYNAAAQSYNQGMRSFSGLLAKLTGVSAAPTVQQTAETPNGGDSQ